MNQSVAVPPRPQNPSDPVPPDVTIRWEALPDVIRELPPIMREYWKEVGSDRTAQPLDPDWQRMLYLHNIGMLELLTVRDGNLLVGFSTVLFGPQLHFASTPTAQVDLFFLSPAYRKAWTGMKMARSVVDRARAGGARIILFGDRLAFKGRRGRKFGKTVLKRLGFRPREVVYSLRLET